MRVVVCLAICVLFGSPVLATPIINYQVTDLGPASPGLERYRLSYTDVDFSLLTNQELDIRFNPIVYHTLLNPSAPLQLQVVLLQPDNPPGAFGDFSLTALATTPAPFSFGIDVLAFSRPVAQPFSINQLDPQGQIITTITTGSTAEVTVPEPSTVVFFSLALLLGTAVRALRNKPAR